MKNKGFIYLKTYVNSLFNEKETPERLTVYGYIK